MIEHTDLHRRFAVEISGWDNRENFFVEKTQLEWSALDRRTVVLRNRVRAGSMVFLRLLEPVSQPASLPVACRAAHIQAAGRDCAEVQLEQLWPPPWSDAEITGAA